MKTLQLLVSVALCVASVARGEIVILDGPVAPGDPIKSDGSKPAIGIAAPKDSDHSAESNKSPAKKPESIRFTNRDQLQGTLDSVSTEGIVWQSPEAKAAITFGTTNVDEIRLGSSGAPKDAAEQFSVMLNNGDEIHGKIIELNTKEIELETWFAGRLTIPRGMVAKIVPLKPNSEAIYEGPTGTEGWKISNRNDQPGWKYRDNVFTSTTQATLGREVKFPSAFSFDFNLAWRGYLQLSLTLFSDSPENSGSSGYMLQMNNNYIYLQRMMRNRGSNNLGQQEIPNLMSRSKANVSLKINREAKTIALFIDGEMIRQWTDTGEFQGDGKAFVFYTQGQSQMRISNIRISDWDGKIEQPGNETDKTEEDTARLANNDKVSGAIESISEGKLTLNSSYATLSIPLGRVQRIDLKHDKAQEFKPGPNDVRLVFADRGQLILNLEKFEGGEFVGSSPAFGKAKFKKEAFSRVIFNPGAKRGEEQDDELEDGSVGGNATEGLSE
ncbi:unnamed protein product [uncultured bacterium]|nr:unnamed protein product [uncultured bacterium]